MRELDIHQTDEISGGLRKRPPVTTLAIGEEGGSITTLAVGEEGGVVTTLALGEEGPKVTTLAVGEEGGGTTGATGSALGSF